MPKIFGLAWAFEPFEDHPSFFKKPMFGGLSAYLDDRIVMCLMENPGDRQWRGVRHPFDIWNGILIPTEREYHESLQKQFSELVAHPVLPKWLYLPMTAENFEDTALAIGRLIARRDPRLGVTPKSKKKKKKKAPRR